MFGGKGGKESGRWVFLAGFRNWDLGHLIFFKHLGLQLFHKRAGAKRLFPEGVLFKGVSIVWVDVGLRFTAQV